MKDPRFPRVKKAVDSFRAAYFGRHDYYDSLNSFFWGTGDGGGSYKTWESLTNREKKDFDWQRVRCYTFDLVLVGAGAVLGTPIIPLIGIIPSLYFRYKVAKRTKRSMENWDYYKESIMNRFYLEIERKEQKNSNIQNQNPQQSEHSEFEKTLGLDSIDDMIQREYGEDDLEGPDKIQS